MKNLFLTAVVLLTALSACKEDCTDYTDPECPNFNPCRNKKPVEAAFIMEFLLYGSFGVKGYVADTFDEKIPRELGLVKFTCTTPNAEPVWILGLDTIRAKSVVTHFHDVPYGRYPIILQVHGPIDSACFPQDDGFDQLTRYVHTLPVCSLDITGRFRVLFEGETDSSLLHIRYQNPEDETDSCSGAVGSLRFFNLGNMGKMESWSAYYSNSILFVGDAKPDWARYHIIARPNSTNGIVEISGTGEKNLYPKGRKFNGRKIAF